MHNVTMAAADDSAHVLGLTTAALVGQATCGGVAKRAGMRSSRVTGSGPFRAQGRGVAEAEGGFDLGMMEPLEWTLLKKVDADVGEDARLKWEGHRFSKSLAWWCGGGAVSEECPYTLHSFRGAGSEECG